MRSRDHQLAIELGHFTVPDNQTLSTQMIFRAFIVVACYALSSFGILLSIGIALEGARRLDAFDLVGLSFLYAWLAHVVMSVAWVRNRKLGRAWVISGTAAGFVGVCWLPVGVGWFAAQFSPTLSEPIKGLFARDLFSGALMVGKLLWGVFFPVILVLPCLLLAIHLVRFHWPRAR